MRIVPVLTTSFLFALVSTARAQELIPFPQRVATGEGSFTFNQETAIHGPRVFLREAALLYQLQKQAVGVFREGGGSAIDLVYDPTGTVPEAYHLEIVPQRIVIKAHDGAAIIHGIETIRQLLPPAIESHQRFSSIALPALTIDDYPRYAWRGMHLDVSRHFFSIDYLHRFIDRMSLYKMNKLHLHLTDDQGWRVEIKKYPLLTQRGAWRAFNNQDSVCMAKSADNPDFLIDSSHILVKNGRKLYGGYYTQEQLKELVAFAAARHIEIIPEIDMPGHMMAAINNYPFLTCNGENKWGELFTKPICPCNESTFTFAENVYSEIMDIFPSKYIHIGGDEVDRSDWARSPACKALMAKDGIKDLPGLQSYFIHRMEKFFASRGRTLVGWDEILEGPISKQAIVMYWRTWVKTAPYKAAKDGNRIVMAPGEPLYFDRPADQYDLSNIYHFVPIPRGFDPAEARLVLGAQACLWSEQLPSEKRADYMSMPRMTALAEALWTADTGEYEHYEQRLAAQFPRLDALGVNYRLPDLPNLLNDYAFTTADSLTIPAPAKSMSIHYTTDGTRPTKYSPVLPAPLIITSNATVKVEAFSPTGSHGDIYELRFHQQPMRPAVAPVSSVPGLSVAYYKASFKATTFMSNREPDSMFAYDRAEVPQGISAPAFGLVFKGYIVVPADGTYTFYLNCDDGGVLAIGDSVVVNNDGNHSAIEKSGQVILQKGMHRFRLEFIEGGGGFTLKLRFSLNGSQPQSIPSSWLKRE